VEHIEDLSFVFSEAARTLRSRGNFFVNELHPFRQYDGKKARFSRKDEKIEVEAFVHHISDFFRAATQAGLVIITLEEFWHETDQGKQPRILSMLFEKR
jgi:malonyl-CoA O-methyltransferase